MYNQCLTAGTTPGDGVVRAVAHGGIAQSAAADHRIGSEGPDSCIVQHQRWWRGDVGEQIGIDCGAVPSLAALDAQGAGPLLRAEEHKMGMRQAKAGVAVRRKMSTPDSSESGAGLPLDRKRWEERQSCREGNERNQMDWDGLNDLEDDREKRNERMVRVGMGKAKKRFESERTMWKYSMRRCLSGPLRYLQRRRLCGERCLPLRRKEEGDGGSQSRPGAWILKRRGWEGKSEDQKGFPSWIRKRVGSM